jgi:hypothetical protein
LLRFGGTTEIVAAFSVSIFFPEISQSVVKLISFLARSSGMGRAGKNEAGRGSVHIP